MDAPETPVNRIGRTIWTVWGYLSGAVAKYLRPEVTNEGNQSVCSRSDEIDLSAAKKINREVKANSQKEENKSNQNDKSTGEVKCSPPEVRVQAASVQWENTDVVKDDENDELNVDTARKQTYHCATWSAETDHERSISGDSESQGCKSGTHVEKEVSFDEGQAEREYANSKDSEIVQELDETGQIEQKYGNNEEYDQKYEEEKCSMKSEDPDNTDVIVQSELYGQDVDQEEQMNVMDHGETECIGGFQHAGFIDEMEKTTVGLKDHVETEIDEDQGPELQVPADAFVLAVQDLLPELEYSAEETDGLSNPEMLKELEKYSDEIAEFCKNEVEEMISENRDATESEQDTVQSELQESAETLQIVPEEKNILNIETELKVTSVLDELFETVNASEDFLQFDSKQDTPENTSETGTGLPVVAIKTDGMFSNPIVCEFPGELRKSPETALGCFEEIKIEHQSLAEEQTEKETFVTRSVEHPETPKAVEEAVEIEQDIETPIESSDAIESQTHQEIDDTTFSLKKHVEFKTELIDETTEINISSEDEEAEPFETQSQSSNIRNVTLQTHELLEFTERESKSSQETMDTFSESLGNSSVSEITGTAEIQHVAEDQTDAKPVLTRTVSPTEFLEETLDLQGESERCIEEQETLDTDVAKAALEYVEEITNQVLKEMIDMEMNLVKETETLEGLSGDEEYQGPEQCVSVAAFVLEEERKLLGETVGSIMEVETTREVAKQNEQDIISQECKTTEADQQSYLCAGTDHGESSSCEAQSKTHVENEAVSSNEGQTERVHANSECKESETAQEFDETGQIEQKDDNDEECDQNHEDEKCEMKSEDPDNAEVTVQSELYSPDVDQEVPMNMMDHEETEGSGGFRHADEHLIDENEKHIVDRSDHEKTEVDEDQVQMNMMDHEETGTSRGFRHADEQLIDENEKQIVDQNDHEKTEVDEDQGPELQVPMNMMDHEETEGSGGFRHADEHLIDENEKHIVDQNDHEKTEVDEDQVQMNMMDHEETGTSIGFRHADEQLIDENEKNIVDENDHEKTEVDEDQGPELQVPMNMMDHEETEGSGSFRHADEHLIDENEKHIVDQNDHEKTEVDEDQVQMNMMDHEETGTSRGFRHADEQLIDENEKQIVDQNDHEKTEVDEDQGPELQVPMNMMDHEETEGSGGFRHADEHLIDENEKQIVDQNDHEKTEVDEDQGPELQVPMNMMDHEETEGSGSFRHADEHLIDENEKHIVDQNDHEKTEVDEDQGPELQVVADALVLEEGRKSLGETMEVESASCEVDKQIDQQSSPECETNEAERHDQIQKAIAGETESSGHEDFMEISRPGMKRGFERVSKDLPVVKIEGAFDLDLQAFEDSSLDFTIQKSRIAVKNPLVRPPKDPRKLLYKISEEPRLPQPPPRGVSVPSKGGIGFKLPGLGAGLPALRKTEFGKKAREGGEAERTLHPQLKPVAVTEDSGKQEQASAKPKWTPPKHPGMGSPMMMAELKNKLKKPVKE